MEIKIKESTDIGAINAEIQGRVKSHFITDQETLDWLFDINTNPDSPQRHLRPKEGPLTLEELREIFPKWTETGLFEADFILGEHQQRKCRALPISSLLTSKTFYISPMSSC